MPPQISAARPGQGTPSGSSGFRGTGAFKPPRPVAGATGAARTTATKNASRSRPAVDVEISDDDNDNAGESEAEEAEEDDDADELERSRISSANRRRRTIDQFREEADEDASGAVTDAATDNNDNDDDAASRRSKSLPPALLARLLHHFFQNPGGTATRLTQDADASVNKYMEIFIREAVARSVAERGNGAFLDVCLLLPAASPLSLPCILSVVTSLGRCVTKGGWPADHGHVIPRAGNTNYLTNKKRKKRLETYA